MRRRRSDAGIRQPTMYGFENLRFGESMVIPPVSGVDLDVHVARVKKSVYWQNTFERMRWKCKKLDTGIKVTRTR